MQCVRNRFVFTDQYFKKVFHIYYSEIFEMFTASFYGSSYITIPLQDAKSTTEIQLRFRTKQADALLFLAAGKTDYCLIKLLSGKLKVCIEIINDGTVI